MRLFLSLIARGLALAGPALSAAPAECRGCLPTPPRFDEVLGIRTAPGALVMQVDPDGPAQRAGLSLYDVITALNGEDFRQFPDLQTFLGRLREAAKLDRADLEVWHFDPTASCRRRSPVTARCR